MQRGQGSTRSDFEDRATAGVLAGAAIVGPASSGRPVKVPLRAPNQPDRIETIRAISFGAKTVKRCQYATGSDLEHRPKTIGSPNACYSVEVSVRGKNQPSFRTATVRAVRFRTKAVKPGQSSAGVILNTVPAVCCPPKTVTP